MNRPLPICTLKIATSIANPSIAAERQIQIRRLDYKRDSLQDIFLRAMGTNHGGV